MFGHLSLHDFMIGLYGDNARLKAQSFIDRHIRAFPGLCTNHYHYQMLVFVDGNGNVAHIKRKSDSQSYTKASKLYF
jgi:hypothetical protein